MADSHRVEVDHRVAVRDAVVKVAVRGRGGDRSRGGGRGRKPESYRVESKKEAAPISDAMKTGDEPLRSFGDLMQFYSKEEKQVPPAPEPDKQSAGESTPQAEVSSSESAPVADQGDTGNETSATVDGPPANQPDSAEQKGAETDGGTQPSSPASTDTSTS